MTKIFYTKLNDNWTEEEDKLLNLVSEIRREKIGKYKFDKDKKLSLYGALLARYGIVETCGCKWDEIVILVDKNGKPKIIFPKNIYFNISHTQGRVLCAVSDCGSVGVDVEGIGGFDEPVMRLVFNSKEIEYINKSPEKNNAFFEIWTKKEAYTKFLGLGLACKCKDINVLDNSVATKIYNWSDGLYSYSVCSNEAMSWQSTSEISMNKLQNI